LSQHVIHTNSQLMNLNSTQSATVLIQNVLITRDSLHFRLEHLKDFNNEVFFLVPTWRKSFNSIQINLPFDDKYQLHLTHPNITKTHRNHMWKPDFAYHELLIFLTKTAELLFNAIQSNADSIIQ
jgi:hypothetical protein